MQNKASGEIRYGILGIETDVLYQWRNLAPTFERRLTNISDIYLTDIRSISVQSISRNLGQEKLPVEHVILKKVNADTITGHLIFLKI
jgi:hypothetical protein